jgi:AcrR family transcriptional regulator
MPDVVKTNSATHIRNVSSRSKSPRKRADREENSRICAVQRSRMLRAAARVVGEQGYNGLTVTRITSGASVSRRTFYQQFANCDECFLELFETVAARAARLAQDAAADQASWRERVRAGLSALLVFLDDDPALGSLLVVDALAGGPLVLECRARWLDTLAAIVEEGRDEAMTGDGAPSLTAEGLVGAVLSVIHARLLDQSTRTQANRSSRSTGRSGSLTGLLAPLMGMIVLPYLGRAAAARELARPQPRAPRSAARVSAVRRSPASADPFEGLEMRLTYRTLRVLSAIASLPGASNREVADAAGVHDQGQISKLLGRLERLGLIHNDGDGQPRGEPNAWTLTPRGTEMTGVIAAQQL